MKPSFATWRLSFASLPSSEQLHDVRTLLEPIARVDLPADYGLIQREYGVSDHLFVEPPAERTAGEIALDCLRKAIVWASRGLRLPVSVNLSGRHLQQPDFVARQAEYEALFHAAARHVEPRLGAPAFVGAAGEAGFPAGQWADWAAVWTRGGDRLMVQQKHNDPALPLELCVVFAPPG